MTKKERKVFCKYLLEKGYVFEIIENSEKSFRIIYQKVGVKV